MENLTPETYFSKVSKLITYVLDHTSYLCEFITNSIKVCSGRIYYTYYDITISIMLCIHVVLISLTWKIIILLVNVVKKIIHLSRPIHLEYKQKTNKNCLHT